MHPKLFTKQLGQMTWDKQDNCDHLSSKSTSNLRYVISPSNHQVRESMVMSDTIKKNKFGTSDNHMPTKYLIWLFFLAYQSHFICVAQMQGFFISLPPSLSLSQSITFTFMFLLTFKQNLKYFFSQDYNFFFLKYIYIYTCG